MSDLATDQLDDAQDEIAQALRMPHGAARDAALMHVGARAMQMSVEVLIFETAKALRKNPTVNGHTNDLALHILGQLKATVDGLDVIATPIEG